MPSIYTIGYTQKGLKRFIRQLQEAGVDAVIDVRLRNTSQLAGFAKRDDLAFLLREGFGMEYEHRTELAPSAEIFNRFRADSDWSAYENAFFELCAERKVNRIGHELLVRYCRPCLLCAEPVPDHCHRRLIAGLWASHIPDLEVVHLL